VSTSIRVDTSELISGCIVVGDTGHALERIAGQIPCRPRA
jgi:hypothetical protein